MPPPEAIGILDWPWRHGFWFNDPAGDLVASEFGWSLTDAGIHAALIVNDPAAPTTREAHVRDLLTTLGHSVTYVVHTSYVDKTNGYDLVVMAPNGDQYFDTDYHTDLANSCPILDLQWNPYRRGLSDSDDVPNTRFVFPGLTRTDVWYIEDSVISWTGQTEGTSVPIYSAAKSTYGELREPGIIASPYSVFLTQENAAGNGPLTDAGSNVVIGVFVDTGATIYPAGSPVTSVEKYIYLNLFGNSTDSFDDAALLAAGEDLIQACITKLISNVVNATATPSAVPLTVATPAPTIRIDGTATPSAVPLVLGVTTPTPSVSLTATPSAVPLTVAIPNPTISAGSTTTPGVIPLVTALPAPTISIGSTATPASVPLTVAIPNPTPSVFVPVDPATVALTMALLSPAARVDTTASPAVVALSAALLSPSPQASATVSAASLSLSLAVLGASLSAGSAVSPAVVPLSMALLAPTILSGVIANAPTVALTMALTSPTIIHSATVNGVTVSLVLATPSPTPLSTTVATPSVVGLIAATPSPLLSAGSTVSPVPIALIVSIGGALAIIPNGAGYFTTTTEPFWAVSTLGPAGVSGSSEFPLSSSSSEPGNVYQDSSPAGAYTSAEPAFATTSSES